MTGNIVFVIRILVALVLYGFLIVALYFIWKNIKAQAQTTSKVLIPLINIKAIQTENCEEQTFSSPEIIVGRDESCDFVYSNETISSRHARLAFHHKQWWIEDLGSTNGTYLNDIRLETPTVIISGDELRIGKVDFLITIQPN